MRGRKALKLLALCRTAQTTTAWSSTAPVESTVVDNSQGTDDNQVVDSPAVDDLIVDNSQDVDDSRVNSAEADRPVVDHSLFDDSRVVSSRIKDRTELDSQAKPPTVRTVKPSIAEPSIVQIVDDYGMYVEHRMYAG